MSKLRAREDYTYAKEGNYAYFGEFEGGVQQGVGKGADWNTIARYVNPVETALYSGSSVYISDIFTTVEGVPVYLTDGSVGTPALSWQNDRDSALYRLGSQNFGWSVAATLKYDWNATRLKLASGFSLDITDMTSGSVLFAGSGGRVSQDNTNFFWDDTSDFLRLTSTAGKQLQLRYNSSNDLDIEVDSIGDTYVKPTTSFILQRQSGSTSELWIDSDAGNDSFIYLTEGLSAKWSIYRDGGNNNDLRIDDDSDTRIRIYQTTGNIGFGSSSEPLFWDNTNATLQLASTAGPYLTMSPVGNGLTGEFIWKMDPSQASTSNFNMIMVEKANSTDPRNNVHFKLGYNINKFGETPEDTSEPALHLAFEAFYQTGADRAVEAYFEYLTASATPTILRPWSAVISRTTDTINSVYNSSNVFYWYSSGANPGTDLRMQLNSTGLTIDPGATLNLKLLVNASNSATTPLAEWAQASTGDAAARWTLGSTISYALGIDNSVSGDPFVLATAASGSAALGTGNLLSITSGGLATWSRSDSATTPTEDLIQSSTGDAAIRVAIGTTTSWIFGADNSDSDKFKLSYAASGSAALGTNDYFTMSSAGFATFSGKVQVANQASGTPSICHGQNSTVGIGFTSGFNWVTGVIGGADKMILSSSNLILDPSHTLSWSDANPTVGTGTLDVNLKRDAANILALVRSTVAMEFRVYNTFTSSTNHEFGKLEWASNVFNIGTEKGSGGGTARPVAFLTDNTERMRILADKPVPIWDEADADPGTSDLDSLDSFACYMKNNKFVIAYNNGGTMTYITIPMDGSTTTWTHNTTAP